MIIIASCSATKHYKTHVQQPLKLYARSHWVVSLCLMIWSISLLMSCLAVSFSFLSDSTNCEERKHLKIIDIWLLSKKGQFKLPVLLGLIDVILYELYLQGRLNPLWTEAVSCSCFHPAGNFQTNIFDTSLNKHRMLTLFHIYNCCPLKVLHYMHSNANYIMPGQANDFCMLM